MGYFWTKGAHIAAALIFVGGLFAQSLAVVAMSGDPALNSAQQRILVTFRRWDQFVTTPALLAVWALGLSTAMMGGWLGSFWLSAKLVFVVLLSGLHGIQSSLLRRAVAGANPTREPSLLRPVVALAAAAAIAILAVVKPFS
jgi:protoporphyrinogen IX oxidase